MCATCESRTANRRTHVLASRSIALYLGRMMLSNSSNSRRRLTSVAKTLGRLSTALERKKERPLRCAAGFELESLSTMR